MKKMGSVYLASSPPAASSQKTALQKSAIKKPDLLRAKNSFEGRDRLPPLWVSLSEEACRSFFETGTLTWQSLDAFMTNAQITLPKLLTGSFEELRDIFFRHFMSNPKSQEVIASQDQWCVDIVKEFHKPRAGVFENTIQAMVCTNEERHEALQKIRFLSFFEKKPTANLGAAVLKIDCHHVDPELFRHMVPVCYQDDRPPLLQEKVFLRGMFGPQKTPLDFLVQDLFGTRPFARRAEKEHLLFSRTPQQGPLRMKIPDPALIMIECQSLQIYSQGKEALLKEGLYSLEKLFHTERAKSDKTGEI